MIDYRDTHDVDLGQLARLFATAGWHERIRDPARLAQLVRGSLYVVSAWENDRLVGFARAISDGASNAYVSTVAVLPEHRGRGIGREMMRRLLDGHDGVLFVLHARPELQPFYAKHGFEHASDMLRRPRKF
jgi:ribosomal protein S18 acetylase RimI-like enzyme